MVRPFCRVTVNGYVRCAGGAGRSLGDAAVSAVVPATVPAGTVMYTWMGGMRGISSTLGTSESSLNVDSKFVWVPLAEYAGLDGGVDGV